MPAHVGAESEDTNGKNQSISSVPQVIKSKKGKAQLERTFIVSEQVSLVKRRQLSDDGFLSPLIQPLLLHCTQQNEKDEINSHCFRKRKHGRNLTKQSTSHHLQTCSLSARHSPQVSCASFDTIIWQL
ncbi:hypothetical protein Pst134EA_015312 [Puccinia striiformis f. sp. tritici]|uniref:hypothetical protein n=1 Tax=Puccinia striiformis f. sp. tritici TaxID=168172 RepID=UPI002007873F|nr:hypothetical protein Pst134EA_015312 [Puccinia striiformis f. sp. tritici]KAH9452475.1 hypothetical protein Pst134EB_016427 [Puccinia striiformis f. sp. tritici]KAH9463227.1 hypothetical protein Pst134EA_015312 [Puccinia striiformis f. sp. tritici]